MRVSRERIAELVSIRSAAWGRGEPRHPGADMSTRMFQSAPRLGAAENRLAEGRGPSATSFNPLRGLGPRRTSVFGKSGLRRSVSIRSAAWGRGERRIFPARTAITIVSIRSAAWGRGEQMVSDGKIERAVFQSAPRLGAAENCLALTLGIIRADSHFSANRHLRDTLFAPFPATDEEKFSLFKELSHNANPPYFRARWGFAEYIICCLLCNCMVTFDPIHPRFTTILTCRRTRTKCLQSVDRGPSQQIRRVPR